MALPDMGKMVGPLPLGAWLAVVGGGLGLALYTRRQNVNDAPTDPDQMPEDTGTTPGVGTGGGAGWIDLNPPASGSADAPAETNEEWGRVTIVKMMATGYPAAKVNSGITKFLVEEGLDTQEFAIVSEALRKYGSPPIPVKGPIQGPTTKPVPPTPSKSTPPVRNSKFTKHTILRGQTMANIASFYHAYADDIYRANYAGMRRLDGSRGFLIWYSGKLGVEGHVGQYLIIPNNIKNYRRGQA